MTFASTAVPSTASEKFEHADITISYGKRKVSRILTA